MERKTAIVTGAGGFIGNHLVKRLKNEGYWVRGVDIKYPEFNKTEADEFIICDLRDQSCVLKNKIFIMPFVSEYSEAYLLAAWMGGAQFCFTGENDADIIYNNSIINLNSVEQCHKNKINKIFFSSSACCYPQYNQKDPNNPKCSEESAYPADPDSDYGMEKLFSERVYLAYHRNFGIDIRIARFHNIFGILGTFKGGREKAPAALCRKVAEAKDGSYIEIFGDGSQTRSFLYIDECLEGIRRLMNSDFVGPLNIGSEEMVTINKLAEYIIETSGKKLEIKHIEGPMGVMGRNSDNKLIKEKLGWEPTYKLKNGLKILYEWVYGQIYG